MTGRLNDGILRRLREIFPPDSVMVDEESLEPYSHDETEDLHFAPSAVVKATTAAQIAELFGLAGEARIPVTPRGGGTGLSGGALPVAGGIVLSTEKMNRIATQLAAWMRSRGMESWIRTRSSICAICFGSPATWRSRLSPANGRIRFATDSSRQIFGFWRDG